MVTLRHPAFPKVTQEVEPECVPGWRASGWIDERPEPECCGAGPCAGCPDAPEPAGPKVRILPVPKPAAPKRRPKNPSLGDD